MLRWLKRWFSTPDNKPSKAAPAGMPCPPDDGYPPTCHCGERDWLEGPSGGLSTNVKCVSCGAVYNYAAVGGSLLQWDFLRQEEPEPLDRIRGLHR